LGDWLFCWLFLSSVLVFGVLGGCDFVTTYYRCWTEDSAGENKTTYLPRQRKELSMSQNIRSGIPVMLPNYLCPEAGISRNGTEYVLHGPDELVSALCLSQSSYTTLNSLSPLDPGDARWNPQIIHPALGVWSHPDPRPGAGAGIGIHRNPEPSSGDGKQL
jgi:hypothetical protein